MTVVSVMPQTDPDVEAVVYKIGLSDGSLLSIKTSYLFSVYQHDVPAVLNKELSVEEEDAFRFAATCLQTEQAALRLIARAEQTGVGLSHKLERRGFSASSVRVVVSRLTRLEILNDSRYAELWLQSRLARKEESPRYLVSALYSRGIDRNLAAQALKSVLPFEGELILLKNYIEKNPIKTGNPPMHHNAADEHDTAGLLKRILKYEGFSAAVIESLWETEGL